MATNFVTKRPHKKSRAGCKTCKTKKIKCDEIQPSCSFCTTRKIHCVYNSELVRSEVRSEHDSSEASLSPWLVTPPESSSSTSDEEEDNTMSLMYINPLPILITSSGNLSATDLRLMHHWSTCTGDEMGVGEPMKRVLKFIVPELAFENDFLLNGILGISSLHYQKLLPDPASLRKQTDLYRLRALKSFRRAVATIRPNSSNYAAVLMMSIMIVILTSQDYDTDDGELTIVRWLVLYRGLHQIIMLRGISAAFSTSVGPVFRRQNSDLTTPPVVPKILLNMLAAIDIADPDYEGLPWYCSILDALGPLYACLREDGIGLNLSIRIVSWLSHGSDEFTKFAREHRPRALVIMAHYLVFMKLVKGLWWYEGISDREIKAISSMVGPDYAACMEIPLKVADLTDIDEIARLLLS